MDGHGANIKYDFHALDSLADTIDGRVRAIENHINDLRSKITNLTSEWEGAADQGFQATRQQWENAATDLNAVLNRIAVAVKQTNADAQQTENSNKNRWQH
jgi:WXG100 family type VII secretion target